MRKLCVVAGGIPRHDKHDDHSTASFSVRLLTLASLKLRPDNHLDNVAHLATATSDRRSHDVPRPSYPDLTAETS